jgi:hypothetical protein
VRWVVRALVFWAVTTLAWIGLWLGWERVIVWTGGYTQECNSGDCGTLGELTYGEFADTWPVVPMLMLGAALLIAWTVDRGIRGRRRPAHGELSG